MAEDDLTKFVEKEIARPGTTKRSLWKALDGEANRWEREARSRLVSSADKRELVNEPAVFFITSTTDIWAATQPRRSTPG
jgi:hypothetical protein